MNVTARPLPPSQLPRTQQSTAPAQPAPQVRQPASQPAPRGQDSFQAASQSKASKPPADPILSAQLGKGGWSRLTPVIRQHQRDNCGSAVAAMLMRSLGRAPRRTDPQLMEELESRYTNGKGTTPAQMGKMLGDQGLEVLGGSPKFHQAAMEKALRAGQKIVALVDSNLISPKHPQAPGSAHWVVIDGTNGRGSFRVKDPNRGTGYYIQVGRLTAAINSGWGTYGAGGMLLVRPTNAGAGGALGAQNSKHCERLGKTPGIGSNSASLGRESST